MNSFKIPFFVYPIVAGLLLGWFVCVIASSVFASPRPLPAVKFLRSANPLLSSEIAKTIINDNIFSLELSDNAEAYVFNDANGLPSSSSSTASSSSGLSSSSEASGDKAGAEPPPPPFNVKLIGVLKDSEGVNSIAVINTDEGISIIKLNMEKNGIKVVNLEDYSAIIEKEEKKYTIVLERNEQLQAASASKDAKGKPNNPASSSPNINVQLKREEIRNELKDLNKVLQSALMSPFYDKGAFLGYKVTRLRNDSPLFRLGLRTGDTITRINGSDLKSPEPLFNMLSQIDDIKAISIDMIRGSEKKTMFVEIQ